MTRESKSGLSRGERANPKEKRGETLLRQEAQAIMW